MPPLSLLCDDSIVFKPRSSLKSVDTRVGRPRLTQSALLHVGRSLTEVWPKLTAERPVRAAILFACRGNLYSVHSVSTG